MSLETGRKGRIKVIKSLKKRLKKSMEMDNLVRWIMLKHGYSKSGAMRLVREMQYAKVLEIVRKERGRERGRGIKYEVSLIPMRKRKAVSSGNEGHGQKKPK